LSNKQSKQHDRAEALKLFYAIEKFFSEHPTQVFNYKQVAARVNGDESFTPEQVRDTLYEMRSQGQVKEVKTGKFRFVQQDDYATGIIDMTMNGAAYLKVEGREEDIYIAANDLNKALDKDIVKVKLFNSKKGRKNEGEVIEIIKRARTEFVGVVEISPKFAFLLPDDRKMYADIFIPLDKLKSALHGHKAVARITDWPAEARNPFGEIVNVLGVPGEHDTEMHAIMAEYGFPMAFPEDVEDDAERIPEKISNKEIAKRRDFRKITTFTIDPVDAKDFDDALSIQQLENGNWEIGVHIADVSHYVHPDTPLDKEALRRGTSIYLVDRVVPMLPEKLSNGVCSLRPQEDKLTFSAVFEITPEAEVVGEWFGKTVIWSDKRFSYEDAQEILEGASGDFEKELHTLNTLAKIMKEERFRRGAISFETEEVKFLLDENGFPIDVYKKIRKDAHKLIEEFMLLANRKVAEYALKSRKGNIFVNRLHEPPQEEKVIDFAKFAAKFGHTIETGSHQKLAQSFNRLLEKVEGLPEQNLIQQLAIRTMSKAYYTTLKTGHYGLSFEYYSHFTSPIRRYPDLMAHRLLFEYLDKDNPKSPKKLEELCKHSSQMELKAAEAERASIKYKQAEYLKGHIGKKFNGIISGVTEWGIYVELVDNKCEGMVRLNSLQDDFYEYDEKRQAVIGRKYKKKYTLGDKVRVIVKKTDLVKRAIDFVIEERER
jgi:ribonuclease R